MKLIPFSATPSICPRGGRTRSQQSFLDALQPWKDLTRLGFPDPRRHLFHPPMLFAGQRIVLEFARVERGLCQVFPIQPVGLVGIACFLGDIESQTLHEIFLMQRVAAVALRVVMGAARAAGRAFALI